MFDLDMIQSVYSRMSERVSNARKLLKRPLTLSEKILYSHLSNGDTSTVYGRELNFDLNYEFQTPISNQDLRPHF